MSNMMMAAVVREFGQPLTLEMRPIPTPGPGEILVKVAASGVCHTDLHAASGDWPVKPALPFIPGHEAAGFVVALGAGVTSYREGDAVGVPWLHDACGSCEHCIDGWETLCSHQHNTGYNVDGGFAEYVVAKAAFAGRLPPRLATHAHMLQAAPILCAGVTTYKGIKETEVRPGEWIAIVGAGGLGHIGIQYAKAMGLHVVAIDIGCDKLELSHSLGADLVIDAIQPRAVANVVEATGGGVHGVLVTAVSTSAFAQSLQMLRPRGTAVFVGLPPGDFPTPIFDVVMKRLTLRGSIVGTRQDLTEALEFAAEGKVRAHIERAKLADINKVFDRLKASHVEGRIVLDMAHA